MIPGRVTHTYALLEVSPAVLAEIKAKLNAAGYADQFHADDEHGLIIDMQGLALCAEPEAP